MHTSKITAAILTATTILGAVSHTAAADNTDTARTCVQFDTRFIRTVTSETETRPVDLPAGQWTMEITTTDTYVERPAAVLEDQDSERVEVLGVTTGDLADGVETAELVTTATVTLDAAVTEVTVTHVHGGHGWQSVMVSTVCFTPVPPVVVGYPGVEIPEVAPPVVEAPPVVVETPAPVEVPAPVDALPVIKAPHFNG